MESAYPKSTTYHDRKSSESAHVRMDIIETENSIRWRSVEGQLMSIGERITGVADRLERNAESLHKRVDDKSREIHERIDALQKNVYDKIDDRFTTVNEKMWTAMGALLMISFAAIGALIYTHIVKDDHSTPPIVIPHPQPPGTFKR